MMLRKTHKYGVVLGFAVLALAGLSATADDKKDDKDKPALSGVWVQKDGELKIEFCDKDVMKIFPHGDNEVVIIVCSYALEKEKLVKAKITEIEGKEREKAKEILSIGLKFSFTWQVKNDTATLGDVKGKDVELLKSHLEGKYTQKK